MNIPTQPQPTSCHLINKLPLELRQAIFQLLNVQDITSYPPPKERRNASKTASFKTPPIAKTCRQLRWEVLSLCLGDHPLHVEIWDIYPSDTVYLKRYLDGLGSDVRLIRELAIHHKVDFYLRRIMGFRWGKTYHEYVTTAWAETSFRIHGSQNNSEKVMVTCDFASEKNCGDQLPVGSVCRCPISDRLFPRCALPASPGPDGPLVEAVYSFIRLMELESAGAIIDRYGPHSLRKSTEEDWPLCDSCHLRRWFLSGPDPSLVVGITGFIGWADDQQCKPM
ncbi:hypothetical protein QBC43DRAFT_324025 [Cladorrhinum sp. PSN259]|nr:hypothetical protein QBC43DRAFT_324025 [Cladorrhinum sp. PSN259]